MTSGLARVAGFASLLLAVFGVAWAAGAAVDPQPATDGAAAGHHAMSAMTDDGAPAGDAPPGVAIADAASGLRLVPDRTTARVGATDPYTFRIVARGGAAVRAFDVEHGMRLHLIVARRDLTGYQHLHPVLRRDGRWTVPLRVAAAGSYRVFADFTPHGGTKTTLGADLLADGDARYAALPAPVTHAAVDGYDIAIAGDLAAGTMGRLTFTVTRAGRPVTDLQPYLEARGHLVALRAGDLAYLHVHPEDEATPGDSITFMTELPTAGRYRLFLQFKHRDQVHTVAFTKVVPPA